MDHFRDPMERPSRRERTRPRVVKNSLCSWFGMAWHADYERQLANSSEDLLLKKSGGEDDPPADLGHDQGGHVRVHSGHRLGELVLCVSPPAVERVPRDREIEVE